MKSILFLDAVLSTKIITIGYWIMLLAILLMGISIGAGTVNFEWVQSASESLRVTAAIFFIILASILVRLWAEFTVVMFKIQQNTRRTTELLEQQSRDRSPL